MDTTDKPRQCESCGSVTTKLEWQMADPTDPGDKSQWLCEICQLVDRRQFVVLSLGNQFAFLAVLKVLAYCTHMILAAVKELSDKVDALDEAIAR